MQGQAAVHAKTKILHLKNQAQNQLSVPGFWRVGLIELFI
jgi:hypothetical protein